MMVILLQRNENIFPITYPPGGRTKNGSTNMGQSGEKKLGGERIAGEKEVSDFRDHLDDFRKQHSDGARWELKQGGREEFSVDRSSAVHAFRPQ